MASVMHRVAPLWGALLDMAFPPSCPSCREPVTAEGNFCAPCFDKLRIIAAPVCEACGIPFPVAVEAGARCAECLDTPPQFHAARAALVYDATSAPLISALKFHDQWAGLARYVTLMRGAGGALFDNVDVIVPVPLHWRRMLKRRYNQSALLAYGLGRASGLPVEPNLLQRVRFTPPQMRLDRATRLKNVVGAFAVAPHAAARLSGKTVLLIDDVVTTGATANACARVMLDGGAKEVRVLALARTVKE
ncbi:MAG: double zinc ribbon domain-containing protein [Rickettsiales bacterium]